LNCKLLPDKGYERLEPDVMKVASPVLRRGRASNRSFLFGNLHVRFCEGAHSNFGAITPIRSALWALLDDINVATYPVDPVNPV